MTRPVSIIIPTWNGRKLLAANLPSVVAEAARRAAGDEIIIVDNASADGTAGFLSSLPGIRVLRLDENLGFGPACNAGVAAARHPVVLLLNNDVAVSQGFLEPMVEWFSDPAVFAVMATARQPRGRPRRPGTPARTVPYASGGYSAFDREKFLALGGFHPLYAPFYGEDRDLGWRAWKRGWKSILEPSSGVVHADGATTGGFNRWRVERVKFRNRAVFLLSCRDNLLTAMPGILKTAGVALFQLKWHCFGAIPWIVRNRRAIMDKRRGDRASWKLTDAQVSREIMKRAGGRP